MSYSIPYNAKLSSINCFTIFYRVTMTENVQNAPEIALVLCSSIAEQCLCKQWIINNPLPGISMHYNHSICF